MRLLFVNNDGGGFADHIEVESEISVAQLFAQRLPGRDQLARDRLHRQEPALGRLDLREGVEEPLLHILPAELYLGVGHRLVAAEVHQGHRQVVEYRIAVGGVGRVLERAPGLVEVIAR